MRLENEFEVDADIERAWLMLTDLEQVMPCIPGASMDGRDGDTYRGNVKIKVGPIGAHLHGTARFESRDDPAHEAVIRAIGKDGKGSASVNSSIHARLVEVTPQRTKVLLSTDLDISGRMAQFGRGAIADVGARILNQFAANIGQRLSSSAIPATASTNDSAPAASVSQPAAAAPAAANTDGGSEIKVLDLIGPMVKERYAQPGIALLVGLLIGWLLSRRGGRRDRGSAPFPQAGPQTFPMGFPQAQWSQWPQWDRQER